MKHQREVRLGMVLYGGVSLAVYENGVVQEIYNAMREEGVYKLIATLIDSDIVIDIVSGTSAGGVNGIMLAHALANQSQFAPSADLWRQEGDIQALLRKQKDPNGLSVLDSTYYQQKLSLCFANSLLPDPSAPEIEELDLFITSTDANGRISTVYDDLGHAIDIKNHRALFKLAFRSLRKNDLQKAGPNDLATLSRMTSCFPVAFQPVSVTTADQNFFEWGKLRDPAVYLDGGILNNKPFTSTINTIASRTATREVERFLIYVEPNPEQFLPSPPNPPVPSLVESAFTSLISIPGYQSIAADLEAIAAHNDRAGRLSEVLEALPPAPRSTRSCLQKADVLGRSGTDCDRSAYIAARLMQLRDQIVECILNDEKGRGYFPSQEPRASAAGAGPAAVTTPVKPVLAGKASSSTASAAVPIVPPPPAPRDERRSGRILVESFKAWPGDGLIILQQYDIFFRMRRAKHLANTLMRVVKQHEPPLRVPDAAWELVNHYFKLYEIMKWAMITWVNQWDADWKSLSSSYPDLDTQSKPRQQEVLVSISVRVWTEAEERMQALLQSDIPIPSEPDKKGREDFYNSLSGRLRDGNPDPPTGRNLLDELDNALKMSLLDLLNSDTTRDAGTLLRDEFCRFLEVDRQLFLLQLGSRFESLDIIRVVRFSPLDAQRGLSRGSVEAKVRGSALASFGGFFKKSWRANDIMMGRLDAACLLVECLLTKERLATLAQRNGQMQITVTQVQACFPHLGANANALAASINRYLARATTATEAEWNALINDIVSASHDEIQRAEWPRVIASAIEQESDWGRYHTNSQPPPALFDKKNLVWNRAKERPEDVLVQVAAQAVANGTVPAFTPGVGAGRSFLEDIPDYVLTELGALATIRIGKGLLDSISDPGLRSRVAGNQFFNIPFNWIAPIIYKWERTRRTQPSTVVVFNAIVPVFCVTLIVFGIMFYFLSTPYRILALLSAAFLLVIWAWKFRK